MIGNPDLHPSIHPYIHASDILAADHACYTKPADRADFPRLQKVMTAFPEGFRLWTCQTPEGKTTPVGYTGWYPIARDTFNRLHERPETIKHRGEIMPFRDSRLLYIFNFSIIEPLRGGTPQSRLMMQTLAQDIAGQNPDGLAAVTVSEDGVRAVRRFGMEYRGDMTHEGDSEGVYTWLGIR